MSYDILLVEDSKAFSEMLQAILGENPEYSVHAAASFAEAQKLVNDAGRDFEIALLDLNLPDAPNGEIVDLVVGADIKSIVFTTETGRNKQERIWKKGICDYVLKEGTHNIDYLQHMIERILKNRDIKVLVVDDNLSVQMHTEELLKIHNFQVLSASDGRHALEVLKENPDIQLVITDSEMPNMDGITLIKHIRKLYKSDEMAVLGMSALDKEGISARFIKNGANDFLPYPFTPEEFYCRVNQNLDRLERISHLEALNEEKNRFLGIASHDIRSPLGGILGLCDCYLDSPETVTTEELQQFFGLIKSSGTHILDMINSLLDISMIESGKFSLETETNDISALIQEHVKLIERIAAQKEITLQTRLSVVEPFSFDASRVKEVIDNFITNAIKYSPTGTTVTITLEKAEGQIRVSVTDQGQGISKEDQNRLFQMYSKVSSKPTGGEKSIGLGLAICKKIIEAHGGTIGVDSEQGKGSCFYFTLPA